MLAGDYSFARPPVDELAAHYSIIIRYVLGSSGKWLQIDEARQLHGAGISICLVAEGGGGNVLRGYAQGLADGRLADAQATARGFPKDRPIYMAADTDIPDSAWPAVEAYARGFRDGSRRPTQGIYGGAGLIQHLLDVGLAQFGWLAAATEWDHGHMAPGACLRQTTRQTVAGVDDDVIMKPDVGQWPAPNTDAPEEPMDKGSLVQPEAFYRAEDGTLDTHRPHPHAGEVWHSLGLQRAYVPTAKLIGLYKFLGVGFDATTGGPVLIDGDWFDNIVPIPFPVPGGPVDVAGVADAVANELAARLIS